MFHDDGLEVYLKPAGDENDNIKLAEFELSETRTVEGDERTRRCAVLARHDRLKVVVRPSREFKMHSASALIIQINLDSMPNKVFNRYVIQRSQANGQFEQAFIRVSDTAKAKTATRQMEIAMSKADEGEQL